MHSMRKRAVIASAFGEEVDAVRDALKTFGMTEVLYAETGGQALQMVHNGLTDVLVANAVLSGLDGVALMERMMDSALMVYPAGLLLIPYGLRGLKFARLDALGISALVMPASREALFKVLEATPPERRCIPEEKRNRVEALLTSVGVPNHPGRDYLVQAILLAWMDTRYLRALTSRLYPAVAGKFSTDSRHVERAMRHVIDSAWQSGEMEAQYNMFGDTIDAKRGSPTCGEMIAQIADILRWEGKK